MTWIAGERRRLKEGSGIEGQRRLGRASKAGDTRLHLPQKTDHQNFLPTTPHFMMTAKDGAVVVQWLIECIPTNGVFKLAGEPLDDHALWTITGRFRAVLALPNRPWENAYPFSDNCMPCSPIPKFPRTPHPMLRIRLNVHPPSILSPYTSSAPLTAGRWRLVDLLVHVARPVRRRKR